MPEFYRKLQLQHKLVLLLLLFVFFFSLIGLFSLLVLAGAGLNAVSPWQEESAWLYLNVVMLLSGVCFIGGIYLLLRNRPDRVALARLVERRYPELKENLSTAVEVMERGGPANPIEAALLRQIERETESIPFRTATLPRRFHPVAAIIIVISAGFLSDYALQTQLAQKARYYQLDKLNGVHTGLIVEPGDAEAPRGSDLVITAQVERWELEPQIILQENGETVSYPMMLDEKGVAQFTLFDLQEATRYRVETPSLRSPEYAVSVYDPPTLDAVELKLEPPAYTRMETLTFSRLLDIFPVEGTTVTLGITTDPANRATLRVGEERLPFDGSVSFTAQEDTDYQLTLVNAEGRKLVTETFVVDVTPDEPPVAEVVDPGEDTSAELDGIVPLELYAADDFGVTRVELHLSVSGLPRRPVEVFQAAEGEPVLERSFLSQLEIPRLSVEHGDIISYYFKVIDNREPEPNVTQTSLFFVEVVADIEQQQQEQESGEGEGGGETQEINIRAIIVELKRVTRETHRSLTLEGETRRQTLQQLGAELNSIEDEARQLLMQIGGQLLQVEGGEFFRIMRNALERLSEAEQQVNADLPAESIPLQEEALSDLIKLESYIRAMSQPSSTGEGTPTSGSAQNQGQSESQDGEGEELSMSMAEMQELMAQLNAIAEDQAAQNRRYQRAERSRLSENEREQLTAEQTAIRQSAGEEIAGISGKVGFGPIRRELEQAAGYMQDAERAVTAENNSQASSAGARSNEALLNAVGLLDEKIRQAAAEAIDSLISQAGELAGKQSGAAQQSAQADASGGQGAERKAMHGEQLGLNDEYQRLMAELERRAAELSGQFPEAGEQLSRAGREAGQARTDASMTRAANALLYGRFGKASELQGEAAQNLDALAEALRNARDKVPPISSAEIEQLLAEVMRQREAVRMGQSEGSQPGGQAEGDESAEGEPRPNQLGRLGNQLQDAGQLLRNDSLSELGERMQAPTRSAGTTEARALNMGLLDNAAAILQQYLRSQLVDERIRYKRQSAPPPDKYRILVEEYFKNLAEEP